jgi:hypothetical protein
MLTIFLYFNRAVAAPFELPVKPPIQAQGVAKAILKGAVFPRPGAQDLHDKALTPISFALSSAKTALAMTSGQIRGNPEPLDSHKSLFS